MVQVEQTAAVEGPGRDRPSIAAGDEPVQKVVRLLAVGDAGKAAVLAFQKHAGVHEHEGEKPRLTLAEPEEPDAVDTPLVRAVA